MKLKLPTPSAVRNKKVILKVDFNVPLKKTGKNWKVADTARLESALETLNFLRANNATILILTHLGRPNGKYVDELSTKPIAKALSELIKTKIFHCNFLEPKKITEFVKEQPTGSIIMLENIRFWPGEKKNDLKQAQKMSEIGQIFINDGFSVAHRAHMSVVGLPQYLPSFAGFGFKREVQTLYQLITQPKRPFVTVIGGAKICDKVTAVEQLSKIANAVLVGGGVANNFLAAEGYDIADSYIDEKCDNQGKNGAYVHFASKLMNKTKIERVMKDGYVPLPKIIYPSDVVAAASINSDNTRLIQLFGKNGNNGNGCSGHHAKTMFLDIGPKTIRLFKEVVLSAGTVFWNGPMGVFEQKQFSEGTREIAKAIAKTSATTILGGGDTIAAVNHFGLRDRFDYVSAAGGAALEFLSGKILPGIKPLLAS